MLPRILPSLLILLLSVSNVKAGAYIQIGSATNNMTTLPMRLDYLYSLTQSIYTKSQINVTYPVYIDTIAYYYNGGLTHQRTIQILIAHTSKSSYSGTTDWEHIKRFGLAYNASFSWGSSAGWYKIPLSRPYYYNNIDNLCIYVDNDDGGYNYGTYYFDGTIYNPDYRSLGYASSSFNYDESSPPTATVYSYYAPNIRLYVRPADRIQIGIGGSTDEELPLEPYNNWTYSQCLYDQSDIDAGEPIKIDTLYYQYNGYSSWTENPVAIYLGNTTKSSYSSTTNWVDDADMTNVFSGSFSVGVVE